ncbi:hypothetical protein Ddc_16523 [Ditylenchus destructor]|nr:hypothetical protein Ddc_16523 [Ditylenchus destructor]
MCFRRDKQAGLPPDSPEEELISFSPSISGQLANSKLEASGLRMSFSVSVCQPPFLCLTRYVIHRKTFGHCFPLSVPLACFPFASLLSQNFPALSIDSHITVICQPRLSGKASKINPTVPDRGILLIFGTEIGNRSEAQTHPGCPVYGNPYATQI